MHAQEEVYYDTTHRIFPGPGGVEGLLSSMIRDSTKRIDKALSAERTVRSQSLTSTSSMQASATATGTPAPPARVTASRHQAMKVSR